jgi:hypothetical protein
MSTDTLWTVAGIWLGGNALFVAYMAGRAWLIDRRTRQAWKRTPILGPVRVNVRRVL